MTTPADRPHPSRPRDPRIATWRDFLIAHARLARLLDEDLRAEHDLSLAEYDALLQLAEAPGRRLRMHQLADRVLLSRSGVTRLIDRLVARRLGRAQHVPDGRPRRRGGPHAGRPGPAADAARDPPPRHRRHFLDAIDPTDLAAVGRAMRDVLVGLETDVALEDRRTGS